MIDKKKESAGMAVDSAGNIAYDPSANVLSLVEAAVQRLDDLRAAETRRQDDLRTQTERHLTEIARLTTDFQEKLRDAEAKRIDAIRAVDVNAVSVASARAADQATVLASQVQVSADALRSLVATTQAATADQYSASMAEITKRLSELERSKYEGAGRSTVADPQLERLANMVEKLAQAQATGAGKSEGISATGKAIIAAVGLFATILMIIGVLGGAYLALRPSEPAAPAVSYVPVPSNVQSTTQPEGTAPP